MKSINVSYIDFDFVHADKLIRLALEEDSGKGDVTSELLIPVSKNSVAEILVKEQCVIAGIEIFRRVFAIIDKKIRVSFFIEEGSRIKKGTVIGEVSGNTRKILRGERIALNLLQRMSGIATATDSYRKKLSNGSIKIIDTRKTTPNMRIFEKLAVRIGGGANHRIGLHDMMLIKDNHIEANGGIEPTLERLKKNRSKIKVPVEIEVKDLAELETVCNEGAEIVDRVMLDNFKVNDLKLALELCRGKFEVEVSGGINKDSISGYRKFKGIDFISIGALTHTVDSVDISLEFIT